MLVAARAILGIAGATLAPATLSLIRNIFENPEERAIALSAWTASNFVGAAIGPAVGGVLLEYFAWPAVFLIGVPFMMVVIVLGPRFLPEYRDPQAPHIDFTSTAMSVICVLATVYGLKHLAEHGIGLPSLSGIAGGASMGVLFVRRQSRLSVPLIDREIFRTPGASAALGTYSLISFVGTGMFVLLGQFVQLVLKLRPIEAGLWTLPLPLGYLLGAVATPFLIRHMKQVTVMTGGLAVGAVGFFLLSCVGENTTTALVAMACATYAVGLGAVLSLASSLIVGVAPPKQAGVVAAISETASELSGALGVALLGSLGVFVYRLAMTGAMPLTTMDLNVSTLGGAVDVAHRLGGEVGDQLLEVSRKAFTQGMRVAALASAISLICAAAWVWRSVSSPRPMIAASDLGRH